LLVVHARWALVGGAVGEFLFENLAALLVEPKGCVVERFSVAVEAEILFGIRARVEEKVAAVHLLLEVAVF
jgi:hypothetical protein